jgi:peptide/nickel transport system substrate-binding protein
VLQHLRWQLILALGGIVAIGALLLMVTGRRFEVQPAKGGQLVEAMVGPPTTLNPLFASSEAEADITALLFSGLTRMDAQGLIQPDLATWTLSPDGRTYTFTLRPDAVWQDGQPVTADDVLLTARLAKDPAIPVAKTAAAAPWQHVETTKVDDRTVTVKLPEPYAPFLAATTLGLLPAHLLGGVLPADLPKHRFSTTEPVGNGGFRLVPHSGSDANSLQLTRFEPYWRATGRAAPFLDTIRFQFYPTRTAAREALGQRAVQAMGRVPADSLGGLGADTRLYNAVDAGYTLVFLNPANDLFSDTAVRQALSLGLDRSGMIQDPKLLNGQGLAAASPIPPGSWAYDPTVRPPPYDPAQARRILEQAGWLDSDGDGVRDRDGKPLSFKLGAGNDPQSAGLAERIRRDWKAIGVTATVEPLDQQSMVNNLHNHAFDAVLFGVALSGSDPDPYPLWHSSQVASGQNFAGFNNAEADRLLTEARQPMSDYPQDVAHRKQLYSAFQALFAREQPALMLFHPIYTYAVADPNVGGVQLPQLLVSPSDRYMTLPSWYVRTERVLASGKRRPTPAAIQPQASAAVR